MPPHTSGHDFDKCQVCGGGAGSLTTDCPGTRIDADRRAELRETDLDYTDDRGWHLAAGSQRSPRFGTTSAAPLREAPADLRAQVAPVVDWAVVDRSAALQHALAQQAIAWVIAERTCDARAAELVRVEAEAAAAIARAKLDFQRADQQVQRCDDDLRQAARRLVAVLEAPAAQRGDPP